jgi:hypothetical protein
MITGLLIVPLGCSSAPQEGSPEIYSSAALSDVGGMYASYILDAKKPPAKKADFNRYENGYPTGLKELRSDNIIVFWGANLSDDASDKVLAYEKATPVSGGIVLMQDGKTIKKMSAEEFKSVPKAGSP